MKILHITPSYKPAFHYGGPTVSVARLCEALTDQGHEVEVFTTTANGPVELPVQPGITTKVDGVDVTYFKRITKDHTHFSPDLFKMIWQRAADFDAVHVHSWWNFAAVLGAFTARLKNKSVIVSPRGMLSDYSFANSRSIQKKLMHTFFGQHLLNRTLIHVTSEHEEKQLAAFTPKPSIYNIPNIIYLPKQTYPHEITFKGVLKLIFFSRIHPKKGLNVLLTALTLVRRQWQLTIAGSGDEDYIQQLQEYANKSGLGDRIDWVGFKNEKNTILAKHHLMVLPSHDENFGNVIIESLHVGTPVLVSRQVGLAHYVDQHNLGWLCDVTPASIAAAIDNIDKERLQMIRDLAPDIIDRDFNEKEIVQRYLKMYNQAQTRK